MIVLVGTTRVPEKAKCGEIRYGEETKAPFFHLHANKKHLSWKFTLKGNSPAYPTAFSINRLPCNPFSPNHFQNGG